MTAVFNPDNTAEALLLAFLGFCGVISVVYPVWLKVARIDEQTTNNHEENLRDEITRNFKELREELSSHRRETREELSGLKQDIRAEREDRIEGDKSRTLRKEDEW